MIYSSKMDFKPFARVWRAYESGLKKLQAPIWRADYFDGEWSDLLDYRDTTPHEDALPIGVMPPRKIKPGLTPSHYEHDGMIRIARENEADAMGEVLDAVDEWAHLLHGLEDIPSESIPECIHGAGIQEIRSSIYSSLHGNGEPRSVSITWTTECAAPVELLRLASRRLEHLNEDEQLLVIRAVAGWLSTKAQVHSDATRLTDADFVVDVCLALANSNLFPPAITEWHPERQVPGSLINSSTPDLISRTHASSFELWCKDFFQRGFRDHENELKREYSRNKKQANYGLLTDINDLTDFNIQEAFVSPLDPLQMFETKAEVERLTSGLSQEEMALLRLRADGYSISEIAQLMHVHKATVQSRLFRIRSKPHIRESNY